MLDIKIVVENFVLVWEKFDGCSIVISCRTFPLTLILNGIKSFNVILGMDWLLANWIDILCYEKCIRILLGEGGCIIAHVQNLWGTFLLFL